MCFLPKFLEKELKSCLDPPHSGSLLQRYKLGMWGKGSYQIGDTIEEAWQCSMFCCLLYPHIHSSTSMRKSCAWQLGIYHPEDYNPRRKRTPRIRIFIWNALYCEPVPRIQRNGFQSVHFKITVELWNKIFISTSAIMDLVTSTLNFETNCFTRDKEQHFIMTKVLIH